MFTLIKLSDSGWEKEFKTEQEAAKELSKWVCPFCEDEAGGNLHKLLETFCGEEFMLEEEETLEELVKEFFDKYLNRVEESDEGRLFNPITVSCCRAMMVQPLGELLQKMQVLSGAEKNPLETDHG